MNHFKQTILILGALVLASPEAFARMGGIGDGGGHGFSSTPQDVKDYLQKPYAAWGGTRAEVDWRMSQGNLGAWMALSPDYAPNPIVRRVLQAAHKAYPGDKFRTSIINRNFAVSDACYDHDGALSDGSTTIGNLDAPICLNARTLARYPSEVLAPEIIALLYHEWTHQLGFGEAEAVEMQNYVKHYLVMEGAMNDGPNYSQPMREGGVRTIAVPDQKPITVLCISPQKWSKQFSEGSAPTRSKFNITLFTGQSVLIEAQDTDVSCSDLPQVDCHEEPADAKCVKGYVSFGKTKELPPAVGPRTLRDVSFIFRGI